MNSSQKCFRSAPTEKMCARINASNCCCAASYEALNSKTVVCEQGASKVGARCLRASKLVLEALLLEGVRVVHSKWRGKQQDSPTSNVNQLTYLQPTYLLTVLAPSLE